MARQVVYKAMNQYQPRLPSSNAYDYYISAARQLKSPGMYVGSQQPPTREEVRWIELNQDTFNTLRQGYTKPYRWPFQGIGLGFLFDDFGRVRNLARLVNARIRRAIASKDGMDAVSDWRIGFKMARDMQGDLIVVYLVGVAVEAIIHAPIIQELDFFSAHECRELARTLIKSERTPDRIGTVVEGELRYTLRTIDQLLPEHGLTPQQLHEFLDGLAMSGEESDPETDQLVENLKADAQRLLRQPAAYHRLRQELRREIVRTFQALSDSLALRSGRYRPMVLRQYDTNTLFGYLMSEYSFLPKLPERYWDVRTRRRLLIAHLLLRKYRLREGHYPSTLEALNMEELAIDPFSRRPLIYRLTGERYLLYSVGADGKDDGGHNPSLKRDGELPRDLFLMRGGWR